jgi:hypothetical protein
MKLGTGPMNPGGIIGVALGFGISMWNGEPVGAGDNLIFVVAVIVGAIGGNYLWRMIFPKKE